jgi:hypothetical protein
VFLKCLSTDLALNFTNGNATGSDDSDTIHQHDRSTQSQQAKEKMSIKNQSYQRCNGRPEPQFSRKYFDSLPFIIFNVRTHAEWVCTNFDLSDARRSSNFAKIP